MNSTPLNIMVVNGNEIISSSELPAQGQAIYIKAAKDQKYLITQGKDGAAPEHITVKRVGDDLQVFTQEGAEQPDLIIEDFYTQQGELAGMAEDGTYHTYAAAGDGEAFSMLEDGASATLLLSNTATTGLVGLGAAGGLLAGMSAGMLAAGALAAVAAITGVAVAVKNSNDKGSDHHDNTPPQPGDLSIRDGNGKDMSQGGDFNTSPLVFSGTGRPGDTAIVYDGDKPIAEAIIGEDGKWTIPVTLPEDGQDHDLSVGYKGPGGQEGPRTDPVSVGYDSTPPATPNPDDMTIVDGDGKDLSNGGSSKANPIDFRGENATPGDTVIVYDGDKPIGSVIVGEDGRWHIPVTLPEDGQEHDLSVGIKDPAGNESGRTPGVGIGYDGTPPTTPNPDDMTIVDGDGKDLSNGGSSKANPIDFRGENATPGDTVIVYDGDTPVGSVIVGEDGSWHIPVTLPEDGQEHDLSVGVTDPAGNQSARTPGVGIGYDTTPPAAPNPADMTVTDGTGQDLSAGGNTKTNPIDFRGENAEPGATVIVYDGDKPVGSVIVGDDGTWHIPVDLDTDGRHDLSVGFTDPAGNESDRSPAYDVGFYENPPLAPNADDISIVDGNGKELNPGDDTNSNPVTVSGSGGRPGDAVIIYDGANEIGRGVVGDNGEWRVPVTLSDERDYDLSVGYEDPMNTAGPATSPVVIGYDVTPPADPTNVMIEDANGKDLSAGGYTNANPVSFSGSGEEGDIVIIRDASGNELGRGVVDDKGQWQVPVTMPSTGDINVNVGFEDSAGNQSGTTPPVDLGYNSTPPSTPVVTLDNNDPTLSGAPGSLQPGDNVEIFDGTTSLGNATINPDGSWSWTPPATIADGDYQFIAKVTDKYGNTSADSKVVAYSSDTTVWDFDDSSNPGWTISDAYSQAGMGNAFQSGAFFANTLYHDGQYADDVLYKEINLVKGQTYTFSFDAWSNSPGINDSALGIMLDGKILLNAEIISETTPKTITVTFVAQNDGPAKLSIFNGQEKEYGNDFWIDNPTINQKGPTSGNVISGGLGINSQDDEAFTQTGHKLLLNQDEAVLDLSKVADQVQDVNSVSLEGHGANTLNISINDVLTLGKEDLYFQDGSKQMMINGDKEDTVNLESINGDRGIENWNSLGEVNVNGTVYNVYQSDNHDVELLIQQGIQIQQQ
ncbi:hypothetical protein FEM41_15765 [Jejubacter calystegiae]|uniref:Uncharacterized protein n=1 Tax=Jejubacter calystegiae TaxID=2579935 RepID=A0A4P8YM90_9ENTR|nr:Ig-like domain-containing protein [Jejubacter calystegiae]QCT20998.1 hypothetical protein FEM41_15765 [Jejubacter calystegiae]